MVVCETSRLPHFLRNRLTDGCEIVSLMCRPAGRTSTRLISVKRLVRLHGYNAAGRFTSNEESTDLIWNLTSDLPCFNVVLQPATLLRALFTGSKKVKSKDIPVTGLGDL
jgi:hypothetical protein